MVMRVAAAVVAVAGVWGGSAYVSGRIAARKARGVKRWVILGLILGPFVFPVHACYPARYKPETIPCPECGKPLSVRAVACHHCHYRFPAVDVMITRAPTDADSRRGLLSEIAREYGIPYADATQMLERLPVAGYRHVLPDQVSEYVRRLEAVGATVTVVPAVESTASRGPVASPPPIRAEWKSSAPRSQ